MKRMKNLTNRSHDARDEAFRRRKYRYKGGRQGTGGIPNPDDAADHDSAGSFRGTSRRTPREPA